MYSAYLYTSSDGGAPWTERTAAGSRNWYSAAMSADRAAYGPPAERELTDAEYDEMQRMAAARARIERERATAAAAVPYSSGYAQPRGAGASRATTGQAQMTPEQIARIEANRRLYEGR